jgi:ubiquinone/menaquinone biosynthesis C-methylase UbiE
MTVALEPSASMARLAIAKGIPVVKGEAEHLPFHDKSFHVALMVTSVCFLKDIPSAFSEVSRVLDEDGTFIIGMIDRESALGRRYEAQKESNPWYRDAHFHTVDEVTRLLQSCGFGGCAYWQTLFPEDHEAADPLPGFGMGSFVVIRAQKTWHGPY